MSEERDRAIQDWFNRSEEALPPEPFTQATMQQIRRRLRYLRWQRYGAMFVAVAGFCLLLSQLIVPLNALARLPLAIVDAGGEQWPLLVVVTLGFACWLLKQTRDAGFLSRA